MFKGFVVTIERHGTTAKRASPGQLTGVSDRR